MTQNAELARAVIAAAKERDGRKTLTCAQAFQIAERFAVPKIQVGRTCNEHGIRISHCQLGCFK
jgi:hypothetical protein